MKKLLLVILLQLALLIYCGYEIREAIMEEEIFRQDFDILIYKDKIRVYDLNKADIKEITAYSSWETCQSDCIMASGKKAYIGAVACPREMELGSKIYIDGLGEFICEDRTALRFNGRIDIFVGYGHEAYLKAMKFGIKHLKVI